jgi:putative membrane protein
MLMEALSELGFVPIAAICIFRLVPLVQNTRGWQLLLPAATRPGFLTLMRLRWIGEAVNGLLPVAQVGGDVARASLVASRGVPPAEAAASMIGDLWTAIVAQVVFAIFGAIVFAQIRIAGDTSRATIVNVALATVPLFAILTLHGIGIGRFAKRLVARSPAHSRFAKLAGGLTRLDEALTALMAREGAMAAAFGWHLVSWLSQVGETWLLLTLVGSPVSASAALVIESMATAARGGAFFVPGGLGVQEMTVVSMSQLVGVNLEAALALGIAKRAREILVGVPGLVAWALETRAVRKLTGGGG